MLTPVDNGAQRRMTEPVSWLHPSASTGAAGDSVSAVLWRA
ncbi:MAG: hypothetical protein NTU68_08025 [Actinobacteria bacterium]|nr:hypothetical protein [Actinomycetota bacterium]